MEMTFKKNTHFTGDDNSLKEAAVILFNLRMHHDKAKRQSLTVNDNNVKYWQQKADNWISTNIKIDSNEPTN